MIWTLSLVVSLFCSSFAFDDWDQFQLVWSDEFDTLDLNNWQYEISASGGGNNEFQLYTPDPANSFVQNGMLYLKPSLLIENTNPATGQPFGEAFMEFGALDVAALYGSCTDNNNNGCSRSGAAGNIPPVMSAKLTSLNKFSFTFGRAVISAKMPVGDWIWPAIWMMPNDNVYGGWPISGEMDIIETIGNRDFKSAAGAYIGVQHMGSTLHWGPAWNDNHYYLTSRGQNNDAVNYGDSLHTFILDWSENGLGIYVDNEDTPLLLVPNPPIDQNPSWVDFWTFGSPWNPGNTNPWTGGTNMAPFDQAFRFIFNVAVGTTNGFITDNGVNQGGDPDYVKPWSNSDSYNNAMLKFYNARGNWQWTWNNEGDNNAMQIDYVRVYQRI